MFQVQAAIDELFHNIFYEKKPNGDTYIQERYPTRNQAKKRALELLKTKYKEVRIWSESKERTVWDQKYACVCSSRYKRYTCICIPFDSANREELKEAKLECLAERRQRVQDNVPKRPKRQRFKIRKIAG